MNTNRTNYLHLMTAKGYFCDYCNGYHAEPRHRITLECDGDFNGLNGHILKDEILCPECGRDELTPFNPYEWTPLLAYLAVNPAKVLYRFPAYDSAEDTTPSDWFESTDPEVVEMAAGMLYIEVQDIAIDTETNTIKILLDIV